MMSRVSQEKYDTAELLLPWYVTGRLSAEEKSYVEEVLQSSPELAKDCAEQQQLAMMIADEPEVLELNAITTQDQRLDSLLKRIDEDQQARSSFFTDFFSRTGYWFQQVFSFKPSGWAYALGAVFVFLQVAILVAVLHNDGGKEERYYLAAGENVQKVFHSLDGVEVEKEADDIVLHVQFTPQAGQEYTNKLFGAIGIKGFYKPDGSSVYEVLFEGGGEKEQEVESLVEVLKQRTDVITFVGRGI